MTVSKSASKNKSQALRFSIRIRGSVTSISLRKNLAGLWLVLSDSVSSDSNKMMDSIYDFIYSCLNEWKNENGKGFSDFVSDRMIEDILESEDFKQYREVLSIL